MDFIRLNVLQKLIRTWEAAHPYNAAQVLRVRGSPLICAADAAWAQALSVMHLGRICIHGNGFGFEQLNGELAKYGVARVPATISIDEHLSAELNQAFNDDGGEPPFRPFIIDEGETHWLGIVYRHWVADSVSIRSLLREWFVRIYDPSSVSCRRTNVPRHVDFGYWPIMRGQSSGARMDEAVLQLMRTHLRFRRVLKPRTDSTGERDVHVVSRRAPDGLIDELRQRCRENGARVTDVLLAALAESCQRHVPTQARPNRRDLAVGNVLDIRHHVPNGLDRDAFGLLLGFTSIFCPASVLDDWDRLLRAVAAQTGNHRRCGVARSGTAWIAAALAFGRFVSPDRLYHFYRKELPLTAGLSNLYASETWTADYHPRLILDYLRVSPTGPMAPAVLNTTTLGSRLQLVLTCRQGLFSACEAERFLDTYVRRLESVAVPREPSGTFATHVYTNRA